MPLVEHEPELELARLEAWRLQQLLEVGYKQHRAEQLAGADVDIHLACWLVANGCDQKTALMILL